MRVSITLQQLMIKRAKKWSTNELNMIDYLLFFSVALRPNAGHSLLILEVSTTHTRCTTVGRTPLDKLSARHRDLYLTTHNTHNRQTSTPPAGFEPMISAGERPQTYALDRVATGTGMIDYLQSKISKAHGRQYQICKISL
jgi:hypothetical protein